MIRVTFHGLGKLQAQLQALSLNPSDKKKMLRGIGGIVVKASKDRIRNQIDLNDKPFKPRKSGGVAAFANAERTDIVRTLKPMLWGWIKKIGYRVSGDSVMVMVKGRSSGTAALHQYGALIREDRGFKHGALSDKMEAQGRSLMLKKITPLMADALIEAAKKLEPKEAEAKKKRIAAAGGKEAKDKERRKVAGPGTRFLLDWPRERITREMTRSQAEKYLWKLTGQQRIAAQRKGFRVLPARSFLGVSRKDQEDLTHFVIDALMGRVRGKRGI